MPRGRLRETPFEAWRESERRVLKVLGPVRWKGFNRIQGQTRLAPSTLSAHLRRLASEGKIVQDVRTGLYRRTEDGKAWLDVHSVVQRILDRVGQAGLVGPAIGPDPWASATTVCTMPAGGPSALSRVGDELPRILAEIHLADLAKRGLVRRRMKTPTISTRGTRDLLRALPRIFVVEVDWDRIAQSLTPGDARLLWRAALSRM